jgi:aminopeptidase N
VLADIVRAYNTLKDGASADYDTALMSALIAGAEDKNFDPAFRAELLAPPGYGAVAPEIGEHIDPTKIQAAIDGFRSALALAEGDALERIIAGINLPPAYSPGSAQAGGRSLRNAALGILASGGQATALAQVRQQLETANNMTDRLAALAMINRYDQIHRQDALDAFYDRFKTDPLVIQKWFAVQVSVPQEDALETAKELTRHSAFSMQNPNTVRAVIGVFAAGNPVAFHRPDGNGYRFVADQVLVLDNSNPQVAARLLTAFRSWRTLETDRRGKAESALQRIAADAQSRDVRDIVSRTLAPA